MIVTSFRCYLNVLTQLWDAKKLLGADYYIADLRSPNGNARLSENMRYNEMGQIVEDHSILNTAYDTIGMYSIKYGDGGLDPEPIKTDQLMGINDDHSSAYERFIKYINNPEIMLSNYNNLFKNPLRGNGLHVIIYYDFENLKEFGHIICQYLSKNFGVDIIFLDAGYIPSVRGYDSYMGDKVTGKKTIDDLKDYDLIFRFGQALSQSDFHNNVSNLTVFLSEFGFSEIVHLYNLLFPDDPLPPGNYSIDHIRQIIIGRASQGLRETSPLSNIMSFDWRSVLDRYERESEDSAEDTVLY